MVYLLGRLLEKTKKGDKRMKYAKDYKCIKCGKQADVFFGLADPDGTQEPFCESCVEKAKIRIYKALL